MRCVARNFVKRDTSYHHCKPYGPACIVRLVFFSFFFFGCYIDSVSFPSLNLDPFVAVYKLTLNEIGSFKQNVYLNLAPFIYGTTLYL